MPRIVVYAHRYRRPPKKKPRSVQGTAAVVVHTPKPEDDGRRPRPKAKPPASAPPSGPSLPTIVIAKNEKRLKRLRAELRMAEPSEPSPDVDAFFARNVRPGGPLPPERKPW